MTFQKKRKRTINPIDAEPYGHESIFPFPYFEGWEPDVYPALSMYRELPQPRNVVLLGLRSSIRCWYQRRKDYFTIYPNLPQRVGKTHDFFLVRVEVLKADHRVFINFGTALAPSLLEVCSGFRA
ncbi:hypothetical protein A7K93_08540 [Candidatus Methylacidiphilum fumarolicum]|nr:hypothetical protein A7K73_10155 [Candidatus Methylacidiphilum fumarolicum]TFE72546.1 hypothetical protein A7K93_08540 [Candidatus Methylacidiphilum fumarolicum]TFE74341.1 hypothetical protein A7K72_04460 [Candidatus Methylacidiphilum fumarolicum]TFE75684.1 hypothetical protein A7D33_10810 [Candidatus Methylacidiphilum fumarolicum]